MKTKTFAPSNFFTLLFIFFTLQGFSFDDEKFAIKDSKIMWVGSKITGSHEGTVDLNSGYLTFVRDANDNQNLTGGEFVIDMSSITCTDLSGKGKAGLESHLKSVDFFDIDNFPKASLKVIKVEKKDERTFKVNAEMTIKGITQKMFFDATISQRSAVANIIIDRTLFGIIYKSGNFFEGLADKAIYDEFEMRIVLNF